MVDTIDGVVDRLTEIIAQSHRESSRLGYFAALYRRVTIKVKQGIASGRFQNGERMEMLDVVFANRYLEAYDLHRLGKQPVASWQVSFEAADQWKPLIVQQLLLGINAHINLDLGIAAVTVSPGDLLASLKQDFDTINSILAELVLPLEEEIGGLSPWIGFLEKIDPSVDDATINFSMKVARNEAWKFALKLNGLDKRQQAEAIVDRDRKIAELGNLVLHPPGVFFKLGLMAIRLRESNDIPKIIDALGK